MLSAVKQINEHHNIYAAGVNNDYDNPPIGIMQCTDKAERVLYDPGGLSNVVFASTYTLHTPSEERLKNQVWQTNETNERLALGDCDESRG